MRRSRAAPLVALSVAIGLLPGCLVVRRTRDVPGSDLQVLAPAGLDRAAIERLLGPPLRTWEPRAGVRYQQHVFREGVPGSAGAAGAIAFMDVITLGLLEVLAAAGSAEPSAAVDQAYRLLWIGFDSDGRARGTWAEFDVLPDELPPLPGESTTR